MKTQTAVLIALSLLFLSGAHAQDDAAKNELARMQGEWRLVRGEENGEAAPEYAVEHLKWKFNGNQLTFSGIEPLTDKASMLTITLDPTAKPKCIDLKVVVGSEKGAVIEGIYEWEKNDLKVCLAFLNGGVPNRPLEFGTRAGSTRVLFVLRRVEK